MAIWFMSALQTYATETARTIEGRAGAIARALRAPELQTAAQHRESAAPVRALTVDAIYKPPALQPNDNWDELRFCRRTFSGGGPHDLEACVGVLPPDSTWRARGRNVGDYVYVVVKFGARFTILHERGKVDTSGMDHIRLNFLRGGSPLSGVVIMNEAGPGGRAVATAFAATPTSVAKPAWGALNPLPDSDCTLQLPSREPNASIYVCRLATAKLLPAGAVPPSILDAGIRMTAEVLTVANGSAAQTFAASFKPGGGDIEGTALDSLDAALRPHIDSGASIRIIDEHGGRVWASDDVSASTSARPCGIWCRPARAVLQFLYPADVNVRKRGIEGLDGYEIRYGFDFSRSDARFATNNANVLVVLGVLLLATGGVYAFVFRKVIRPIEQLTDRVQTAIADPDQRRQVMVGARADDEISKLARAFDELLKRVGETADLERDTLQSIGHDIRTPLEALMLAIRPNHKARHHLDRILRAVERFDTVASVHDAYVKAALRDTSLDVAAFVKEIVKNRKAVSRVDALRFEGEPTSTPIAVDADRLEDALEPILDNAVSFYRAGTDILVRVTEEEAFIVIDIENRGPRIPEAMLEDIFQYEVTTRRDAQHGGQGLGHARKRIRQLRGAVLATNLADGVRFRIRLPKP